MSFIWHYFYTVGDREMNRRIAVRGIALHDGKLLCVRLRPYQGKIRAEGGDFWCLPGGGLEDSEAILDGIEREMLEETGIKPVIGKLLYVHQFAFDGNEYLEFFFHITNSEDYLYIDLSNTTHGEKELAEIAFIDPTAVRVLPTFLSTDPLQAIATSDDPARIVSLLK
jgi:8-oxo-dGTP pyrophosphatase MutT (NUDIX family)